MQERTNEVLDLLYEEPYKVGHWVGFPDLTEELHNDWIKHFLYADRDETLQAHRGSYKTTCLALAIAIFMIIYPTQNIIFLRKTDDDITEVIKMVGKILKGEEFKYLVFSIWGVELNLILENTSMITTNLYNTTKGASQLLGIGIKGSLTGKHGDLIITDDIINAKDRVSKAERDFTKSVYMELQNIKNRGGRIINTGTPWHKEDAFTLMPNITKYDCYQTGLISREELEQIRNTMTNSLFSANYELRHIASENVLFENPQFFSEEEKLFNGVSHIDASYGGADGTAFTIIKKDGDKIYVFGKRFQKHIDDCINEIDIYIKKYLAGSIYCEDNADKGYLAKDLRQRGYYVNRYHENTNKFVKISTYLKKYWQSICFFEGTDIDYINEILDYNEQAEHDDSPDSLASVIREVFEKQTDFGFF